MKCKKCGQEWGDAAWPSRVAVFERQTWTPVLDIQKEFENGDVLWELEYLDEKYYDSDIKEIWYECDYCGVKITEDEVMTIIKYIRGKG